MKSDADRFEACETAEGEEPDFRRMIESIPHLVWQSDSRGDWVWASRQWAAFTGQTPGRSRGSASA